MTSTIDTSQIDETFPVAGVDQSSQGFRTNFAQIKTALNTAASEITSIQSSITKYSRIFNATDDWGNLSNGSYSISILESDHNMGSMPVIQLEQSSNNVYTILEPSIVTIGNNGDITLTVTSSPDNRFSGLIIIF